MTPGQAGRKYNLNEVYKDAFGYVRPPYPTLVIQSRTVGYNPLGTIKALRGAFSFSTKLGTEFSMPTKLNGYQLPNEPTLRISGSKNIVETKLTRKDPLGQLNKANVLEEINLNNFRLRLRGIIINEENPDDYPEEAVRQIRDICLSSGSVSIENPLATIWGISQIAIEDFDFQEVRGNVAMQAYDIIGYSDEFVDLEVVERAPAAQVNPVVDESPELAGT